MPTMENLRKLLDAAGFELRISARLKPIRDTHMRDDINRLLAMSPEDRLREVANISRFELEVRRALSRTT